MRKIGIIKKWNDEKGFGFVASGPDMDEYFFHINSFRNKKQRPTVGLEVDFEISEDRDGRPRAINVGIPGSKQQPLAHKSFATSLLFLIMVVAMAFMGLIPKAIGWLYLVTSVWAFMLYYRDKSAAKKGKRRTPEATLHNIALIGGWPGALFAQQLFRHKSSKASFRRAFWATVVLNVAALLYLLSPYGAWLANEINRFAG